MIRSISGRVAAAALALAVLGAAVDQARAANGAYAVDAADISDLGSCKVESWYSMATNSDIAAVANPSCVVEITRPVELSMLTSGNRTKGAWSTSLAPKAKINLEPTGIGKWGVSALASGTFDAVTGANTAVVCATGRTTSFQSTSSTAIISPARIPTGSPSAPPSGFRRPAEPRQATLICN